MRSLSTYALLPLLIILFYGCSQTPLRTEAVPTEPKQETTEPTTTSQTINNITLADVNAVQTSGDPGNYTFSVSILSPDSGCDLYADWWEVVDQDEELIYRRILLHSHVNEQPFTRSGGPVPIDKDRVVFIRAHMFPTGYGGTAFQGSIETGFLPVELNADFAPNLTETPPLPDGCNF
jgi:hypothetical protein